MPRHLCHIDLAGVVLFSNVMYIVVGIDSYACQCAAGFEGVNCTINTDDCIDEPCINGDCVDRISGFDCNCHPGWSGM